MKYLLEETLVGAVDKFKIAGFLHNPYETGSETLWTSLSGSWKSSRTVHRAKKEPYSCQIYPHKIPDIPQIIVDESSF